MRGFQVWRDGQLIGESDLERHDGGMNVRSGRFYPGEAYASVRGVFRIYDAAAGLGGMARERAEAEYCQSRDALGLVVRDRDGTEIRASGIHIVDFEGFEDEMSIEVYPPHT